MSHTTLIVLMDGRVAGTIQRNQDRLRLRYEATYQASVDATSLSLSLPLLLQEHSHRAVDAFLWGLLPDNEAVLRRWGRQFGASARNAFSLLSTPVGEDCAGAVHFVAPDRLDGWMAEGGEVEWLDERGVAERIRSLRQDESSWLGPVSSTGQFSLAGAQPKTALYYENGRWGVPHGHTPTTHILKPAIPGIRQHEINEHLCLSAARRAGLPAAESRIARFEDMSVVVLARFDRARRTDGVRRVHQEDLCQAHGVPPSQKYQADGGPSPESIVDLFRRNLPRQAASNAVASFVDALAFNWLIAGTDAHAKNYGLLLAGTQVRLAPLYDLASALLMEPDARRSKLAMKIGGEYRLKNLTGRNWAKFAAALKLDHNETIDRIDRLAGRVPDAFCDAAKDAALAELGSDVPSRLTDLVAVRVAECRRALAGA